MFLRYFCLLFLVLYLVRVIDEVVQDIHKGIMYILKNIDSKK